MRDVFLDEDTIYAPITPNIHSPVSVIRISGDKAIEIVDSIFRGKRKLKDVETHRILYGDVIDKEGVKIDDVLVSVMRKPNSYTGEDVVEISCHGNPLIVSKVMDLLKKKGARMALPGEFTKRAVLNGKLDLIQAEAVNSLINSRTLSSVKISRHILDGILSEKIKETKEKLLDLLAYLEVLIDHPEEDLADRDWKYIENTIIQEIKNLSEIVEKSKKRKFFSEGIKICIAGRTNVGKSSLMNALIGEDRAIVSEIPGTTRDVVKEIVSIEGVPVSIFDTAGIRNTTNTIEREGIKRTINSIKSSDIILLVFDASSKLTQSDIETVKSIKEIVKDKNTFVVINKIDILGTITEEILANLQIHSQDKNLLKLLAKKSEIEVFLKEEGIEVTNWFFISAKRNIGVKKLAKEIVSDVIGNVEEELNNILINNDRHQELIEETINSLEEALKATKDRMSEEFIAIGIRDALSYIGEMVGEVTTEDLMDRIFKNFCVGK